MILIRDTDTAARHPWPEDVYVRGGVHAAVRAPDGSPDGERPRVAFVEAYPPDSYLLGEGPDMAAAEADAWAQLQRMRSCPAHPDHGPFEAREYGNGSGFCTCCGTWLAKVLLDGGGPGGGEPQMTLAAVMGTQLGAQAVTG